MTTDAELTASALTTDKIHLPAASLSRVSPNTRKKAAESGEAMKDGSFPVRDSADLKRAIKAFGRAKDKAAAKRHIIRRARALKKTELLPDTWKAMANRSFPGEEHVRHDAQVAGGRRTLDSVLAAKAERHNAASADDRQVTPGKLKAVYRRGLAEYTDHPAVSEDAYAQARVNSFLRLLAAGAPDSPTYVTDNDLLPATHPARVVPPFDSHS